MFDVTKKNNTFYQFLKVLHDFSLEFKKYILSHPVTSKQPHKIVQRLMGHPVLHTCTFLLSLAITSPKKDISRPIPVLMTYNIIFKVST